MERVATLLTTVRIGPAAALAAGMVVLAACVRGGTEWGLIVKFLLGRLAYSTSDAAALFTLGFGLALLAVRRAPGCEALWRRVFGCSLAAGYVLHLGLLVDVARRHGLSRFDFAIFWADGANSFNALTHSHVGKAGLAVLAQAFGGAAGYDAGQPFLSEMAPAFAVALAANFVLCVLAGIVWTGHMMRVYAGRRALQWLIALAVLGALKSQLDGGLLGGAGLAAVAVVCSALARPSPQAFDAFWRRRGPGVVALIGAAYVAVAAMVLPSTPPLPPLLGAVALYGWLLVAALHGPRRVAAVVFAGYLALLTWVEFESELKPLLQPLPAGASVWRVDPDGGDMRRLPLAAGEAAALHEIYRRLGDDPLKPSSVLVSLPGMEGSGRLEVVIGAGAAAGQGRIDPPQGGWQFAAVAREAPAHLRIVMRLARDGLPPMQAAGAGTVVTRNNAQVYLHWLARRLSAGGWPRFVLGLRSSG